MYIALTKIQGRPWYVLRETCRINGRLDFRDLFDLGPDPSVFIKYPGGNAFYFDEDIADALCAAGANFDTDDLEDLFRPWIKREIKQAIDSFQKHASAGRPRRLSEIEKDAIAAGVHWFDKRRAHYLRFGSMDQGPIENMPAVLFREFVTQSRDEIEQWFLKQEFSLKSHELKSYVYTIFNLQSFFSGFMAKTMPHALDQERVDHHFLEEICRINGGLFNEKTFLDDYMIRYLVMFFDHAYDNTTLLDDFAHAFMSRHRKFRPPAPRPALSTQKACKAFHLTQKEFAALTKKGLTRQYRKLARQVHPDAGGSHEKFVELNLAYESLLKKI
jgi:hypothetical protein